MDKNRIMMIVIIALLVILLGTIAFVSIYALNLLKNTPNVDGDPNAPREHAAEEVAKLPQEQIVVVDYKDPVKGILTSTDGSTHAITFKISIGVDNSDKKKEKEATELTELLAARENVVKSFVSEIIYNHTHEDYNKNSETMRSLLESEILERLQMEFSSNLLVAVYISDYLYQ